MSNQDLEVKFNNLINTLSSEEKKKNRILATYTLQVLIAVKYLQSLIINFRAKDNNEQ